ncbi:MAG: amidohydrolase [Acidimicrobiales bacterium]|nr:amidohydrolase [Acidimicrobiales bacterium]
MTTARMDPARRDLSIMGEAGHTDTEVRVEPSSVSRAARATYASDRSSGLLPDPTPRERTFTIISVDDHLVEPPDVFEGRIPASRADSAPRLVTDSDGREFWEFDGNRYGQIGLNAVVGRPKDQWSMEPARFDEMRPGCWDPVERIKDMDIDGVYASVCYPSLIAGFAGTVFARCRDQALGLDCIRAWNEWHLEEWVGDRSNRLIPLQLPWLNDPELAAAEVRRNAERGFKAVSFLEQPVDLGYPSLHTGHWDPFLAACEETGTVVCLHCASSGWSASRSPGAPLELLTSLFPVNALVTCADWLWSGVPVRFPALKILLAESGIDWVPMLIHRTDYVLDHSASGFDAWPDREHSPTDVLRRNFWFSVIDITSVIALRQEIGVDHIVLESDYPHADSTWPDTQEMAQRGLRDLPPEEVRRITWANAAELFGHPVPDELQVP